MSDSENDLLPSNVFTFQNENTMISAKGPGINSANITNLSFRNNVLTSTMHMPRNFERQRFGEPSFDQRSMYYRRETSPASMYSGSDARSRANFHQSYYGGGTYSQRSMHYGRGGSPMSMRSIDSNASVSAVDIALAFKNVNFNKHDLRMIKDAYNKFMKRRIRKKIEKRRNMRLFLKGYRRKSGYDSGEQGSDSSISSDDCKSTASAMYKDNMSCRSTRTDLSDFRRTIKESNMYKDCSDSFKQNAFRNMLCMPPTNHRERIIASNSLQHPPAQSQKEFAVPNAVQKGTFTQKERFNNGYLLPSQRFNKSVASVPILERDPRLQARQKTCDSKKLNSNETLRRQGHVNNDIDSDQEEIFSEVTVRENSTHISESQYEKNTDQGKRGLETEDSNQCSERKRPKLSSPVKKSVSKNYVKTATKESNKTNGKSNKVTEEKNRKGNIDVQQTRTDKPEEFEFLKPQFPVRKSGPAKTKEMLISKSAQPLTDDIIPLSKPQIEVSAPVTKAITTESQEVAVEEQTDTTQNSTTDLSMRPSFIKRKLFSQKMDVTEKKNLSSDALNLNSPQTNVYSAIQKEKHKARKLVTNQSCLSRDIVQEGNHLLDLIHKIVPPDRMNVTNVTNKTSISTSVSSKNPINDDDKWDVTSVISTCNNDDVSDTYTDEEIFKADNTQREMDKTNKNKASVINKENSKQNNVNNQNETNKKNNNLSKPNEIVKKNNNVKKPIENAKKIINVNKPNVKDKKRIVNTKPESECRILVEKLPQNQLVSKVTMDVNKQVEPIQENDNKKNAYNCVKSFWDTDFESDMESPMPKRPTFRTETVKENLNRTSNIIQEPKKSEKQKILNVSLASVSESIKSKMMPTNNLGKLKKFNISKTLSIKAFLTPKQVKCKPKVIKETEVDSKKMEDLPKQSDIDTVKKATKPTKNPKSINNVATEVKKMEPKKTNTINGELNSSKTTKSQPKVKAKTAKPQSLRPNNKTAANKSMSGRTVRTPKRKACCDDSHDQDKSLKSSGSKSKQKMSPSAKKPKLVDSSSIKSKAKNINDSTSQKTVKKQSAKKMNDSIAKKPQTKASKNNKTEQEVEQPKSVEEAPMNRTLSNARKGQTKASKNNKTVVHEVDQPKSVEVAPMNRTLRSRRIDLSSSINSSSENVTLQIRSLRTRRVDLSNSLKNSSLDETIKKGSKSKAAKTNHTEVLNKKPRSVKNLR